MTMADHHLFRRTDVRVLVTARTRPRWDRYHLSGRHVAKDQRAQWSTDGGGGLPGIQPSRDFVTPSRTPTPQSPPPSTLDPAGTTRPPRPATPARTVETSTSPPALDPRRRPVRTRAVCPPPDVPLGTATGVRGTHPRRHSDPTTRDERPETRSQRGRPFPLSLPRGSPDDTPTLLPPHGTRGTVGCGRGSSDLYT